MGAIGYWPRCRGGLVGALTGWGFAESEAREYESRVAQGDILLAVQVDDDAAGRTEDLLRQRGASCATTG